MTDSSRPLLSIIIPVYNSERFIRNTLTMLIAQGLDDCEVIIVNDGSTDQTEIVCRSFIASDERIKIMAIKNSGVSVARNTGLRKAIGIYVYFFDSDDTLTEGSLDFFRQVLLSGKDFQIFSFGYEMQVKGKTIKRYTVKNYNNVLMDTLTLQRNFFQKKLPCNICSCIYKREFLMEKDLNFTPNLKVGEDIEFLIKVFSLMSRVFYYKSRVCFIYQIRNDSVMQGYRSYNDEQFESFLAIKRCVMENKEKHPEIDKEANFFIANLYVYNLFYYLRSKFKSNKLNRQFMINKNILSLNISGIFSHYLIILITKIFSIKILFYLFGKNNI
jgi:UDP-glucose:(glucosyl)LPS beta-1,3-glucosyltransferase